MIRIVLTVVLTVALTFANLAVAQDKSADVTDMQALRDAVRNGKKAYVASQLDLTDAEAKKFWPAYDAYQRRIELTNRERTVTIEGLIGTDRPVSNLYAKNMLKDMMVVDEAESKARRTLQNAVVKALPSKKAARYLQLESKIRAVQAYDIAQAIPLIK